jgi:hypothetical protein
MSGLKESYSREIPSIKKEKICEEDETVFEEGETVMAHLRKEIFPRGAYSKLNYKKSGSCIILRKIFDNAYKSELPEDFDISPIFNVVDLYEFHEGDENDDENTLDEWKKHFHVKPVEESEQFLANKICKKTRNKEYFEYLVKSRNSGPKDALWVSKKELEHLQGSSSSVGSTVAST